MVIAALVGHSEPIALSAFGRERRIGIWPGVSLDGPPIIAAAAARHTTTARVTRRFIGTHLPSGKIGGCAAPDEVGAHFLPAGHDWRRRAQMQHVALDLHHARLGLPQPIREQRHKHGMRQGLFFLSCVYRAAIGYVPKRLFLALLVSTTKPVGGREVAS